MKGWELQRIHKFIRRKIYPKYGEQPAQFSKWDKQALRFLYAEYLKPRYRVLRNNPEFHVLVDEIQHYIQLHS